MSYETYKLGSTKGYEQKRWYTREELEQMDLQRLRRICNAENIKPPSMEMMDQKPAMVSLLYRYLGVQPQKGMEGLTPTGIDCLSKLLKHGDSKSEGLRAELPAKLTFIKGMDSLEEDGVWCELHFDRPLGRYAVLTDETERVLAMVELLDTPKKDVYRLRAQSRMMAKELKPGVFHTFYMLFFPKESMEAVGLAIQGILGKIIPIRYFRIEVPEVLVEEPAVTEDVLVIDYGTTYTTAAVAGNGWEGRRRVVFSDGVSCRDSNRRNCRSCELLPSVVAVKSCGDERLEFLYGYEALAEEKKRSCISKRSTFYNTKRWVNRYREKIRFTDSEGNCCEAEAGIVIRAFLLYVIRKAERQNKVRYKNICITYPVRQKAASLSMYRQVLPEYEIMEEQIPDEAAAVVYHMLEERIDNRSYESGESGRILILDCGGGTSDMVSCEYQIQALPITNGLWLRMKYTHGDTNFGGNNLTYRILQYLRICFARYYTSNTVPRVMELFREGTENLYDDVDSYGKGAVYQPLLEEYKKGEDTVPLCYYDYGNAPESIWLRIRGNYYFLWHIAEAVKRELYGRDGVFGVDLPALCREEMEFHLLIRNKKGQFETQTVCPKLKVEKEEIDLLLKPDVYGFVKSCMEPYYLSGELDEISQICLSGQTGGISLFREVIREYVPGKKARGKTTASCQKKFMCIDGATAFCGAKRTGRIRASIDYDSSVIPYSLTAENFLLAGGEIGLIGEGSTPEAVYGFLSRPVETKEVLFFLRHVNGNEKETIVHHLAGEGRKHTTYEEILEQYPKLIQADIDDIMDGEVRVFIWSDPEIWGFYIVEVARKEGQLSYGEPVYQPFERTDWETDFFDGRH